MTRLLLSILLLAWFPGCTSFREVPVARMGKDIDPGDLVRVTEHDDARTLFRVTGVDEEVVMGADIRFRADDIKRIEREGIYALRAVGGLVELALVVLMVAGTVATL